MIGSNLQIGEIFNFNGPRIISKNDNIKCVFRIFSRNKFTKCHRYFFCGVILSSPYNIML